MKGFFFYQEPDENFIQGFECNVVILNSLLEGSSGFIISNFYKDKIYQLNPIKEISIDIMNSFLFRNVELNDIDFQDYKSLLNEAINFCKQNLGKVVVSRTKTVKLNEEFSLKEFFIDLCEKYHHSYNYCFHLEDGTTWIGATPEVLVRGRHEYYEVFSLAGTRPVDHPFEWTQKELNEQAIVTEEIERNLTRLTNNFSKGETQTIRAGNLEHLLTIFKVSTNQALKLADVLHPTPAVCGYPRDAAARFIKANENHQREFYAGIIGKISNDGVSLFVNLRCAEVIEGALRCYAGGGITENSDPEKEWLETDIKSKTLLSVLKKK